MGLNKRYIDKDKVIKASNNESDINNLFKSDVLIITDYFSLEFYNHYKQGFSIDEILTKIEQFGNN